MRPTSPGIPTLDPDPRTQEPGPHLQPLRDDARRLYRSPTPTYEVKNTGFPDQTQARTGARGRRRPGGRRLSSGEITQLLAARTSLAVLQETENTPLLSWSGRGQPSLSCPPERPMGARGCPLLGYTGPSARRPFGPRPRALAPHSEKQAICGACRVPITCRYRRYP
ncbi:hypothetical protein ES705_39443 [subsurface metagenome]